MIRSYFFCFLLFKVIFCFGVINPVKIGAKKQEFRYKQLKDIYENLKAAQHWIWYFVIYLKQMYYSLDLIRPTLSKAFTQTNINTLVT